MAIAILLASPLTRCTLFRATNVRGLAVHDSGLLKPKVCDVHAFQPAKLYDSCTIDRIGLLAFSSLFRIRKLQNLNGDERLDSRCLHHTSLSSISSRRIVISYNSFGVAAASGGLPSRFFFSQMQTNRMTGFFRTGTGEEMLRRFSHVL